MYLHGGLWLASSSHCWWKVESSLYRVIYWIDYSNTMCITHSNLRRCAAGCRLMFLSSLRLTFVHSHCRQ